MVRVSLVVREGTERFEVTVRAASLSEAVDATRQRFTGGEVRVVFPIDGDEFFGEGGTAAGSTEPGDRPVLLPERAR